MVALGVELGVDETVAEGVALTVAEGVLEEVALSLGVAEGVELGVLDGVADGVALTVAEGVELGVAEPAPPKFHPVTVPTSVQLSVASIVVVAFALSVTVQ